MSRPIAGNILFDAPSAVADDKQIEEAVPVIIEPDCASREARHADAGAVRHILEGAVSPVAKQPVAPIA
jgi:hypothetical protein